MKSTHSYKHLFKNVGILTVGSFGSKILQYFLLPLYTSYLTTAEYGTYDLLSTTINLILPILTVNTASSIMRFSLDKDANINSIISTGLNTFLRGFIVLIGFVFANRIFNIFSIVNEYTIYFILLYLVSALSEILNAIGKGLEKLKCIAFAGIIHTFFLLILNILFLVYFNLQLNGYFLANIISTIISVFYLFIRIKVWKYISYKSVSKTTAISMMNYGAPLIVTSIGWWINNVSDRYVVTWLCGFAANGIYSVAYKIPSILTTLQSIFNQAWQISTVGEYNKNDSDGFFKNIYSFFNVANVLECSLLIALTKIFAHFLFAKEFYSAWIYAPFLMISVVFGSLIGVIDGIFQAVKDSKIQSKSVAAGALTNIILNIIFVYKYGPIGAAVSTLISYVVTWAVSLINVRKYIVLRIDIWKHISSYILLVIQGLLLIKINGTMKIYIFQSLIFMILVFVYFRELKAILKKIKAFR